jgi:uncharacterized protein YxeA
MNNLKLIKNMSKKVIIGIIAVVIILVAGVVFWRWGNMKKADVIKQSPSQQQIASEKKDQNTKESEINTSDWKTYRSEQYGFEVKYPPEWNVSEKVLMKKETQGIPVPMPYIANEFKNGSLERLDFYAIVMSAPFGYVSFVPFSLVIGDKSMESIQCKYNSIEPCFDDSGLGLEKIEIDGKEAFIKKYTHGDINIFLKDLPKNWGTFNGMYFVNQDYGNLSSKDNAKIAKIFEEIIKSIRFLNFSR